jgi:hypothetical protein
MVVARPARYLAALGALVALPAAAQDNDTVRARRDSLARFDSAAAPRRPLRFCAGGDVTLGTNLDTTWVATASARLGRRVSALPPPDSLLAPLVPLLADADVVLLNVESAIGEGRPGRRKCAPGSSSCFAFRSPPSAAMAIRGVAPKARVVGNLANNHARDAGDAAWLTSAQLLRAADVAVTGQDTLATVLVTPSGDSVAVLGFSAWAGPSVNDLDGVRRHVSRAAAEHRRVVVNVHMGAEGAGAMRTANAREISFGELRGNPVAFAAAAVESGADLVIGHGPHVMRAAEWRGQALVLYSLGNLVTYGPFTLREPQNRGALACADLDADGRVVAAELRSTRQRPPGLVEADVDGVAAVTVDRLGRLDFPATGARVAPGGRIELPSRSAARPAPRRPARGGPR